MATAQEAVRRLTIVTSAPGADQAAASLRDVEKAMDGVTVASQRQEKATLSLDQKFASIERKYVEQVRAQQDYEKIQRQVNAAVAQNPALQERANVVLARAKERYRDLGAANDNLATSTGLARHEVINLSRQLQDVGVSIAGGQSPFTVLAQQGTQIADIFGSSKTGTVGGAFKQLINFVGPLGLVGIAVGGIAAAGVFAVNALANYGKGLDDLARSVNTTREALSSLQQAAALKGIGSEDFAKGAKSFGDAIYDAKNNMGQLGQFLRANGQTAGSFEETLGKVADLIKNARDDQQRLQLLQRAGLPATMEWVRFLSQGKDGIAAATAEAVKFNQSAEGQLIDSARKFDEAWAKATTSLSNNFKAAVLSIVGALQNVQVPQWLTNIGRGAANNLSLNPGTAIIGAVRGAMQGNDTAFSDRFGSFAATGNGAGLQQGLQNRSNQINGVKPPVDDQAVQRSISLQQQQLALYGQTATAAEAVRQVDLQIQAARLQGVEIDQKRVEVLKQLAAEQAIGVTSIKAQADAARLDAETVGMSVEAATRYAAAQNAINEARRAGRELTPDNIAQIDLEASSLGRAAGQADLLRSSYEGLVRGPLQTFTSALMQGSSAWDAFKKAAQSALNSITSKLTDMIAQNLWQTAFGGSGGGLGGLGGIGSLFGFSGAINANGSIAGAIGPTSVGGAPLVGLHSGGIVGSEATFHRYVHPAHFDDATRYHTGGIAGDEVPIIAKRGEGVFTAGQMRALGGGGGSVSVGDTNIVINGNVGPNELEAIKGELAAHRRAIAQQVKEARSAQRMSATGVG